MGSVVAPVLGAVTGGLAGAFANQKEGSTNAGNFFTGNPDGTGHEYVTNGQMGKLAQQAIGASGVNYGQMQDQVANGAITGQLFGQNGMLNSATNQYNNLVANPGLTSQDQTAYGQASGNIARMFGTQQQGAAQSLADRGLSNSGVAGATFSGINGNQQEQLAGLQTQIAQNRENLNMQKMGQLQNFISQLGGLGNQATGQAMAQNQNVFNNSTGYLQNAQGQNNSQLNQSQETAHGSMLSNIFGGLATGAMGGMSAMGRQGGGQQMGNYAGSDPSAGATAIV